MKRTRIKAKDLIKELEANNYLKFSQTLSKKDAVEICEDKEQGIKLVNINSIPSFFYYNQENSSKQDNLELLIPTLKLLQSKPNLLKHITVDMGAIKFVVNGADIMRPGITKIEDNIDQNQAIAIVDETHGKAIAVGIATLNSEDLKNAKAGKVIKNIHFVGDEIWNAN